MEKQKRSFDYKWVILSLCFIMVFVCLGFCSSNKGLYLSAITEALDIKRSLFSINDSVRFITTAVCNLFFGSLLCRFGARKLIAFGFISLIGSMLAYIFAEQVLVFYLGGFLLGVGLTFTTNTMASYIVKRWFKDNIGRYLGIVFAANGVGGALAAQIITPIIYEEGNPFGYRNSYTLVAIILAVVGILVVILLRESPDGASSAPVGKKRRAPSWKGIDYARARRMPLFFLLAAVVFATGFILQAISGVNAAHMRDEGMSATAVATVASIASIMLTGSKLLNGIIYDRFGLRVVVTTCQVATVLAFSAILFVAPGTVGTVFGVIFGILFAFALPLETIVIPLMVDEIFGDASYDKILGIMSAMNYAGYAVGTPVVNLCYDMTGSYKPVFYIFIVLMVLCCIAFNIVQTLADKKKKEIIEDERICEA